MAYDERLAERIRSILSGRGAITEKRMFGGIAFLCAGRMLAGVLGTSLVARVGKSHYDESLRRPHVRKMDFTGRPMQGYVYVDAEGIRTARQLRFWLDRCDAFVATLPEKPS